MRCVADEFGEASGEDGVERINGISGDSLNPVTDALHRNGKLLPSWRSLSHRRSISKPISKPKSRQRPGSLEKLGSK